MLYISFKCLEDEDACIFYIKIIKKVKTTHDRCIGINNDIKNNILHRTFTKYNIPETEKNIYKKYMFFIKKVLQLLLFIYQRLRLDHQHPHL